jgi:hypothetical protein
MGFEKTIVKEKKLSYAGSVDFQDFLNYVKKMIKKRGYEQKEKVFETKVSPKDGSKTFFAKWDISKNLDNYHKVKFGWAVVFAGVKEKKKEEGKVSEGSLNVKSNGILVFDKGDDWQASGFQAFFRHFYDKFVEKKKNDKLEDELKEDLDFFFERIQKYLGM